MAKTYIPTLMVIVRDLCRYVTRYRETLLKWLPEGAKTAFNTMADGCEDFLTAMASWDNVEL